MQVKNYGEPKFRTTYPPNRGRLQRGFWAFTKDFVNKARKPEAPILLYIAFVTLRRRSSSARALRVSLSHGETNDSRGPLLVILKNTDAKRSQRLDDLFAENSQSFRRVRGHEHTLALREQVAEQVGNGVSLSSAGRPLHQHAIFAREMLCDVELLLIGWLAQQNILVLVAEAKTTRR